jgi:hypothetical protein
VLYCTSAYTLISCTASNNTAVIHQEIHVSDANFSLLNSLSSADFQFLTTTLPRPHQRPHLLHLEEPQRRPESAIQMAQLASALINNSFNSMCTMSGHSGTRSNNPVKLQAETSSSTMSYQAVVMGLSWISFLLLTALS